MWEPACWRWLWFNLADTAGCLHRWQASSHKGVCVRSGPCRSQLAGGGFGSILQIQPVACIAGKPVPTRVYVSGPGPVGASLLAMASAQSCRYSRLAASLASQLPRGCMCQVRALWEPACWRWLRLNPADTGGCLHRWQPAPTRVYVSGPGPVGASLLAMVSAQSCRYSRLPASLASQPPQGCMCQVWALWEPACWRWLRLNPADTAGCLHRWQASPHKGVCVRSGPCGSQLAGDGFGSILQIQPVACIAGKPAPTSL